MRNYTRHTWKKEGRFQSSKFHRRLYIGKCVWILVCCLILKTKQKIKKKRCGFFIARHIIALVGDKGGNLENKCAVPCWPLLHKVLVLASIFKRRLSECWATKLCKATSHNQRFWKGKCGTAYPRLSLYSALHVLLLK